MSERSAKGFLVAAVLWCVILGVLAVAYKYLVHPSLSEKLKRATSSSSQYKEEITIAADSFSGYCILRSDAVKEDLKSRQIKVSFVDDKADYVARLKSLQERKVQLAVFTVDSLIAAGAKAGEFPGSIVLVIDETKGGDAIVAYQSGVASLQDLNHPQARIVLTPNSPSEFLARVVIAHFNLPNLSANWRVEADGANAVFKLFRSASPSDRKAFVLWEPYVSKALEKKDALILLDSSKLKGYIVDVLVAEREFLRDHPEMVRAVIEAYCRAAYAYGQQQNGMIRLVSEDARKTGTEGLDESQSKKVVEGIQWKNTLENYGHFGLLSGSAQAGLQHLEDMIDNIIDVLIKTKGLSTDPLVGKHHTLFYGKILADMQAANFHPAKGLNLIEGITPSESQLEKVRSDKELAALTPEQWSSLRPVGELRIDPIVFGRGSASISLQSERDLDELAKRIQSFPQFYLRVVGHTRAEGDPEANRLLAQARAEATAQFLVSQGLTSQRIKTEAAPLTIAGGEAQAVSFFVGQVPY